MQHTTDEQALAHHQRSTCLSGGKGKGTGTVSIFCTGLIFFGVNTQLLAESKAKYP